MTSRILARLYLPHLGVFPLVLLWRLVAEQEPGGSFWWLPGFLLALALIGFVSAWAISCAMIGKSLVGLGPLPAIGRGLGAYSRFLKRLDRPAREGGDDLFAGCLHLATLAAIIVAGAAAVAFAATVWNSPLLFAATCQGMDLVALTSALWRCGAYRILQELAERARADGDRAGAVAAVRSYYDEHAALLLDDFPAIRFDSELRVRIPGSATPEDAWKSAREFIAELQDTARRAKHRIGQESANSLTGDPSRDRSQELKTRIGQLDVQAEQIWQEITRLRGQGIETAWLERQLADLRRRRQEAADELQRLSATEPAPTPSGD